MITLLSNSSFDIRFAISALYLWLLFGYLSSMVSCDMQRMMQNNEIFRHFVGIISFILLFTTLDNENNDYLFATIQKTLVVYAIFLLLTKAKWYFSIPTLILITIDQCISVQVKHLKKKHKETEKLDEIRDKLIYVIGAVVVTGFLHYGVRQYNEFGKDFSPVKFLFANTCKI